MFTRIVHDNTKTVTIIFEDRILEVRENLTVAAALLESGITYFRSTPVTSSPRMPFCMMGVCFDCLLVINGTANQQSCMIEVRDGMRIERQSGVAGLKTDHTHGTEKPA